MKMISWIKDLVNRLLQSIYKKYFKKEWSELVTKVKYQEVNVFYSDLSTVQYNLKGFVQLISSFDVADFNSQKNQSLYEMSHLSGKPFLEATMAMYIDELYKVGIISDSIMGNITNLKNEKTLKLLEDSGNVHIMLLAKLFKHFRENETTVDDKGEEAMTAKSMSYFKKLIPQDTPEDKILLEKFESSVERHYNENIINLLEYTNKRKFKDSQDIPLTTVAISLYKLMVSTVSSKLKV